MTTSAEKLGKATFGFAAVIPVAMALALLMGCAQLASAASVEIDLAPYANRNIQANLFPTLPTGQVVPPKNSFGVPFYIPDGGNNFVALESGSDRNPLTVHVGTYGVRKVFTLMQAYGPYWNSKICAVKFIGSAGAEQTFVLTTGQNIRDFFESNFARTINNTSTRPAFECIGRGGAYTNDTKTGPQGFYNFDEQVFNLDPSFARQTLASIKFAASEQYGMPILLGVTAVTSANSGTQTYIYDRGVHRRSND
jgi:hypothetical protein